MSMPVFPTSTVISSTSQGFVDAAANKAHNVQSNNVKNEGAQPSLFMCNICYCSFEAKQELDQHIAEHKHHEGSLSMAGAECHLCFKAFATREHLHAHMVSHLAPRPLAYAPRLPHPEMTPTCTICGKGFTNVTSFQEHLLSHTQTTPLRAVDVPSIAAGKSFLCQICSKDCSSWDLLKSHVKSHESMVSNGEETSATKIFNCDRCKKSYGIWGHWRAHLTKHDGDSPKRNQAIPLNSTHDQVVGQILDKPNFTGSKKSQSDPVACGDCGKMFQSQNHVNRHKVVHTGERPHKCDVCGMRFMRKEHCKRHILTHISDKSLLFCCQICEKYFSRAEHLNRHLKIHTGEKPFKCSMCEKCYSRKDRLQHHLKSHDKEVLQLMNEHRSAMSELRNAEPVVYANAPPVTVSKVLMASNTPSPGVSAMGMFTTAPMPSHTNPHPVYLEKSSHM